MYIEALLKKYDLNPEIFNPMKRNYILNKTTLNNTLNNVCLSDSPSPTPTRTHLINLIKSKRPSDVCLLDPTITHSSIKCDEHQNGELITDDETNLEDTETIEDVTKLLTPYICRKDCIHYEPIGPSKIMPDREFKEFCKLSNYVTTPGCDCQNYENKYQREDSDGCLIFN
jgi:hypothetical protein